MEKFKFIDLFAGIGGFRIAFESVGGECILTCEWDKHAIDTYKLNYLPNNNHVFAGDICALPSQDIPDFDVLLAGFPCQPYSIAGYRDGLKDERGQVFFEVLRIIKDKQPRAILLENVKGLLNHDNGRTFAYILDELEKLGYSLKHQVLNSMTHANIPQNRERVFIVGFKNPEAAEHFDFPKKVPLTKTIHDCLDNTTAKPNHIYDDRYECFQEIKKAVTKSDTLYQWRRQYVRENKSNACPTLTANMGSGGHNVPLVLDALHGIRKLTPRECANFQGFPKTFKLPKEMADSKLYHQFGNSVTVPLIAKIAKAMAKVL